jgi:hypothetical protein
MSRVTGLLWFLVFRNTYTIDTSILLIPSFSKDLFTNLLHALESSRGQGYNVNKLSHLNKMSDISTITKIRLNDTVDSG